MRIIAVIGFVICFVLPSIIYCILAICGRGGKLMKGFWWRCTNLKESNIDEQKYVLRVYGIKYLILCLLIYTGFIGLICEQWIVGVVFIASGFVAWGIIELMLLKFEKYQQCKNEISDEKRQEEYWDNIAEQNGKSKNSNNLSMDDNIINKE